LSGRWTKSENPLPFQSRVVSSMVELLPFKE